MSSEENCRKIAQNLILAQFFFQITNNRFYQEWTCKNFAGPIFQANQGLEGLVRELALV